MVEICDIHKSYPSPEHGGPVKVLRGVSLSMTAGEFTAIMGESGSGKSTLMNIIGGMDTPDAGSYHLDQIDILSLNSNQLARFRNQKIGFVFQGFHLIPSLTALENVMLPLSYQHVPVAERTRRAKEALTQVGLSGRMQHLPCMLSGGQRGRTAIARVIAMNPQVILADEPTGALDAVSGQEVMELLRRQSKAGKTVLLITHDEKAAACADRVLYLKNGKLEDTF